MIINLIKCISRDQSCSSVTAGKRKRMQMQKQFNERLTGKQIQIERQNHSQKHAVGQAMCKQYKQDKAKDRNQNVNKIKKPPKKQSTDKQ